MLQRPSQQWRSTQDGADNSSPFTYLDASQPTPVQDVFPNVATRGLRIKLELNTADTVLQAAPAPLYSLSDGENKPTGNNDGYSEAGGYAVQATVADNTNVVVFKNAGDLLGGGINRVLSPDSAAPTHLFNVGQWIQLKTTANNIADAQIQSVAVVTDANGSNRVQLTLASNLVTGCAVDASVWVNTDSSKDDMDFELCEVRMNVEIPFISCLGP